jgi:hypothetical protein
MNYIFYIHCVSNFLYCQEVKVTIKSCYGFSVHQMSAFGRLEWLNNAILRSSLRYVSEVLRVWVQTLFGFQFVQVTFSIYMLKVTLLVDWFKYFNILQVYRFTYLVTKQGQLELFFYSLYFDFKIAPACYLFICGRRSCCLKCGEEV